jgi:hypothetical protein
MNTLPEKRQHYRRYEDRRMAMMLAVYKTLFEEEAGLERDKKLLRAVIENFKVDRALLVALNPDIPSIARTSTVVALSSSDEELREVRGVGFTRLLALHKESPGAVSLERVRKPGLFEADLWESLWTEGIGVPAHALLSIEVTPKKAPPFLLWLQQTGSSREWGSRDRNLIEELAEVLAKAADKAFGIL